MCDTLPKIKRKAWLEREIDQVEKDIQLIESHPYIYLKKNNITPHTSSTIPENVNQHKKKEETEPINTCMETLLEKNKGQEKNESKILEEEEMIRNESDEKKEEDEELKILNY